MAKAKLTVYFCKECGYEASGWLGRCPGCGAWNTFVEQPKEDSGQKAVLPGGLVAPESRPVKITQAGATSDERHSTGIAELDRVLGGGLVKGSLVLISGDPGIGKSTLMLMISGNVASFQKVLYVSGEESAEQIKMRAQRIGVNADNLYVVSETSFAAVGNMIESLKPDCLVIDSIQTMYDETVSSSGGSVSQIREITAKLMQIAKTLGISTFVVGHVTKDGAIAGPRILEHMVDTVLYFEGERHMSYRILRCVKNRFGSTNEIGVFEMRDTGLEEVPNPSAAMLDGRPVSVPGTAVACTMEGSRPLLVEIQALISGSNLQSPRRMATGIDYNRFAMLLAVLEKRLNLRLGQSDAFANVAGGMKLSEPAADLAIVAAVISSCTGKPVPSDCVLFGEVGLTGEVRSVSQVEKRVSEAERLGFKTCIVPFGAKQSLERMLKARKKTDEPICVRYIQNIKELI